MSALGDAAAGRWLGKPCDGRYWLSRRLHRLVGPWWRRPERVAVGLGEGDLRRAFWTASLLRVAVQGWIRKWRAEGKSIQEMQTEGLACADMIAERSDLLVRGAKGCGEVFNVLAKSLAALSVHPGGVDLFGIHFETRPGSPS